MGDKAKNAGMQRVLVRAGELVPGVPTYIDVDPRTMHRTADGWEQALSGGVVTAALKQSDVLVIPGECAHIGMLGQNFCGHCGALLIDAETCAAVAAAGARKYGIGMFMAMPVDDIYHIYGLAEISRPGHQASAERERREVPKNLTVITGDMNGRAGIVIGSTPEEAEHLAGQWLNMKPARSSRMPLKRCACGQNETCEACDGEKRQEAEDTRPLIRRIEDLVRGFIAGSGGQRPTFVQVPTGVRAVLARNSHLIPASSLAFGLVLKEGDGFVVGIEKRAD